VTLFEPPLVDDDARRAIRDGLGRNLFVEAGAGTGKTTVLVARVVNLFATGTLTDPSALVAITFTEAAAAELRDRIRGALDAAAVDDQQAADARARCAEARRRIDEAVITTLHGFAQRILAEHPLEAGLPPRFEVDDGVLASVRFVERWLAFLDDLYDDPAAARDLLVAHALGLTSANLLEVARRFHERWTASSGRPHAARRAPAHRRRRDHPRAARRARGRRRSRRRPRRLAGDQPRRPLAAAAGHDRGRRRRSRRHRGAAHALLRAQRRRAGPQGVLARRQGDDPRSPQRGARRHRRAHRRSPGRNARAPAAPPGRLHRSGRRRAPPGGQARVPRPAGARPRSAAQLAGRARCARRALPRDPDRRVPGHRPAAARHRVPARRGRPRRSAAGALGRHEAGRGQAADRRRPEAVDLRLPGRRHQRCGTRPAPRSTARSCSSPELPHRPRDRRVGQRGVHRDHRRGAAALAARVPPARCRPRRHDVGARRRAARRPGRGSHRRAAHRRGRRAGAPAAGHEAEALAYHRRAGARR